MGRVRWAGLVAGLLAVGHVRAADPEDGDPIVRQAQQKVEPPKAKELPKKEPPKAPPPPPVRQPDPEVLARISETGGEAPAGSFSRMMGDWVGAYYADSFVTLPGFRVTTTILTTPVVVRNPNGEVPIVINVPTGTTTTAVPIDVFTRARVPVLTRGGFKIAENEGVVPEDRAFLTYNFYRHVVGPGGESEPAVGLVGGTPVAPAPVPALGTRQLVGLVGANPTLTSVFVPPATWDVQRAVIGFEKTAFDGWASFGVRAPFFRVEGDGSLGGSDFGDLSFVFKGLLWCDGCGDAASAGLVVTVPTGPDIHTVVGDIHPTLFQPFVGGVVSSGDAFAMGFTSVVIPTDDRDVTLLFTDIGAGVMVYKSPDGMWVAPTAEVHVTTPLTHRNGGVITVPDLVVLTEGVQCGLGGGTSLAVGVAVPVSGPRPFDWEALVQLNIRY
jgi:hypothetical protein